MSTKKSIIGKLITTGALLVLLVVLLLLKTNVKICEFVATTFARAWIWLNGNFFGWLPFSVFELFVIVAIVALVVSIVRIIKHLCKHKYKRALSILLTVAIVALSGVNLYTVTASFSYGREPLPDEMLTKHSGETVTYQDALNIAEYVVEQLNESYRATPHDADGNVILPSLSELNTILQQEYKRLDSDYFSPFTPNVQPILNKRIMSEMHTVGIFFAPSGEPNINVTRMDVYTISTMAHELAHAKGVMRESDANTVAAYLLLTSDNAFLRYSGYVKCMSNAMHMVQMFPNSNNDFNRLHESVDIGIRYELANYSEHWEQYTLFEDISEFFNDIYLKLQGQGNGTGSYVEPPVTEGTGQVDKDGNEIVTIVNFSNMQNLLLTLYDQGYMI